PAASRPGAAGPAVTPPVPAAMPAPAPAGTVPQHAAVSWENDATHVITETGPESPGPAMPTPVHPRGPNDEATAPPVQPRPNEQGTRTEVMARAERSEPIRVISMKDRSEGPRAHAERTPPRVQLRSLADVSGGRELPADLGHLAPPRDPRQARARRLIDNVI